MEDNIEHKIFPDGTQTWKKNSLLHRLDGPAVFNVEGSQEWWQNGRLHRVDGPAIVYTNRRQEWWQNGQHHRLDGPAVIYANGRQEWWINDRNLTSQIQEWMKANSIIWPWDKETQTFFELTWR